MNIDAVFPLIQGVEYSLVSSEAKRIENSVRAGGNNYLTAAFQTLQATKAAAFIDQVSEPAGLEPLSWEAKAVIFLTPALLALLKNSSFLSEKAKSALTFCQDHLGALYQVVAVVSSVALLFFGQTLFAIPSLLVLGIGYMDRNGYLPAAVRQTLHKYNQPLLIATSLFAGGILDKVFAALNFASWCASIYLSRNKIPEAKQLAKGNLNPQKMQGYLNGEFNLKINRNYIHHNSFPPVPDKEIQTLVEKFDAINWNKHIRALRQKLREDPRFIKYHKNPDLKTDREIIKIARDTLQVLVTSVKERRILEGEPVDYQKLHNYLKMIAKYVEDQTDEMTKVDVLFRLAVEGGEYCGPGKFEVAESIYAQTLGENPDIPFTDKVFHSLQDRRNLWIQKFYSGAFNNTLGKIIDWQDIHNYNLFVNLYGDELGLRKTAAENDDSAIVEPLVKLVVSYCFKDNIQQMFWSDHTLGTLEDTLVKSIGTSKLPKPEFYAFWREWIHKQALTEKQKEALEDELSEGKLYGSSLEVDSKPSAQFVSLMLMELGIAEIETKPASVSSQWEPLRI